MAIAPNTARLLVLTARKSDLEYRLTMLAGATQRLAQENAEILTEKSSVLKNYLSVIGSGEDVPPAIISKETSEMANFDTQLKNLELAQNRLDMEQKKLETQHQAVTAEEDGVQKLVDNSIKNEMGYFKD